MEADDDFEEEFLIIKQEPLDTDSEADDDDYCQGQAKEDLDPEFYDLDASTSLPFQLSETQTFCTLCDKEFKNPHALATHCQHKHACTQCYICLKKLTSPKALQNHLSSHSKEERLRCRVCRKSYSTVDLVKKHLKSHMSDEELRKEGIKFFSCYFCETKKFSYSELVDHYSQHTMEKRYKCKHCKKAYVSSYGLYVHTRDVHIGDYDKVKAKWKHVCPHCNRRFRTPSCLKIHLPRHSNDRAFVCHDCGKSFKFRPELVAHKKIHEDVCKYECKECGLRTTSSWKLKQHSYSHSDEKPFKCEQCPSAFKQKATRDKHFRTVHLGEKIKVWDCPECAKSFSSKAGLKTHSLLHQLDTSGFPCEICGKKMATEKRLSSHVATHSGKRDFPCPFPGCGNSYTEIANLRRHQRATHDGVRRHCNIKGCDKSFTGPIALKAHKSQSHGIGDSIQCEMEWCDQEFPDKHRLAFHMKAAHKVGEMNHKCPKEGCDKAFPLSCYLKHHMKNTHKVKWVYDKEKKVWFEDGPIEN